MRAESRRAAQAALHAILAQGQSSDPSAPAMPVDPAVSAAPMTTAALPARGRVTAAPSAALPATPPPARDVTDLRIDPPQPGVAMPVEASSGKNTGGGSPFARRDGRASTDAHAALRTAAAAARAIDVQGTVDGTPAGSAWMARLAHATQSGAADRPALTTATAQAWGVPDQIVRGLQLQVRNGASEAVIRLHPEHLGEIVVEMKVERDGVVATLKSDTPAVRAWIAAHRDDLEAGLADSGLRLDDLRVSDRESGRQRREQPQEGEAPKRRARRPSDDAPGFEILV